MVALAAITLERGAHDRREDGVCATEAIAWLADEPHSDHPACLSRVLGTFLRNWNDALDQDGRQRLKPYLERAICTSSDGREEERAWLCTDWLVRVCAPAWLELAGVKESPAALRALPALTSASVAKKAQPTINESRRRGAAAREAAGEAAWEAAGEAAGEAAWEAAREVREAARAAAGAARAVAGAAAREAAREAAGEAAREAAGTAAWEAAGEAAGAAGEAAGKALERTKIELQASALELLGRLVKPEKDTHTKGIDVKRITIILALALLALTPATALASSGRTYDETAHCNYTESVPQITVGVAGKVITVTIPPFTPEETRTQGMHPGTLVHYRAAVVPSGHYFTEPLQAQEREGSGTVSLIVPPGSYWEYVTGWFLRDSFIGPENCYLNTAFAFGTVVG